MAYVKSDRCYGPIFVLFHFGQMKSMTFTDMFSGEEGCSFYDLNYNRKIITLNHKKVRPCKTVNIK